MKKIFLCVAFFLASLCVFADPAEGFWISVDENSGKETAGWQIFQENGVLCGKILSVAEQAQDVKAFSATGKSYSNFYDGVDIGTLFVVGTKWIWDLKNSSSGKWSGGFVIDPQNGKRYKCEITFRKADGKKFVVDTLEMRGKVGPFGRSQFWKKASQEDASSLK